MASLNSDDSCSNDDTVATRPTVIQQGQSLPFIFDRGGLSIAGWVCTIYVKIFPSDTTAITARVITPSACDWPGFLTATETDSLTPGKQYFLIGVLTKGSTDEEEKPPIKFYLQKTWVS